MRVPRYLWTCGNGCGGGKRQSESLWPDFWCSRALGGIPKASFEVFPGDAMWLQSGFKHEHLVLMPGEPGKRRTVCQIYYEVVLEQLGGNYN